MDARALQLVLGQHVGAERQNLKRESEILGRGNVNSSRPSHRHSIERAGEQLLEI